jgi:hypothetical protein
MKIFTLSEEDEWNDKINQALTSRRLKLASVIQAQYGDTTTS